MNRFRLVVTFLFALAATPAHAQSALDSLIAADRALSDGGGTANAVARALPDLVLVYPGAPIVAGQAEAQHLVEAQPALRALRIRWVPLHGEVSRSGDFGLTWGVMSITDSTGALRFGKYLSAWRRDGATWRLVAHAPTQLLPGSAFVPPPGFQAGTPVIPSGARAFAAADSSFAALAGRSGAPEAFAAWIAPDGAMFSGSGEFVQGPAGAHRLLDGPEQAAWAWRPVAAFAASSGDLGATVGESTITPPNGSPSYGHYLTLWRRMPDGSIRFIADGGSVRPRP